MMKRLSPLKASLLAILASSTVLAATVNAEPGSCCGEHPRGEFSPKGDRMAHDGMHRMFEGLELTDAQKAEIKKLFAEQRAASRDERPSKEERQARRTELQALITAANFDEAQAKAFLNSQEERRQAMMIDRLKMQNQIYNLLTAEQQAKFKARFDAQADE